MPAASKSDWGGGRACTGTDRYVWNAGADKSDAHALLLGLAYGESLLDVRILLSGGKIPLLKDAASWKLSFETLGSLGNLLERVDGSEAEEGLSYTDYSDSFADVQAVGFEAACTGSDPIPTAKAGREQMLSGTECDCSD